MLMSVQSGTPERGRGHQIVDVGATGGPQAGRIPRTNADAKDNTQEQMLACGRQSRARERSRVSHIFSIIGRSVRVGLGPQP
jgi:hypothetical protein